MAPLWELIWLSLESKDISLQESIWLSLYNKSVTVSLIGISESKMIRITFHAVIISYLKEDDIVNDNASIDCLFTDTYVPQSYWSCKHEWLTQYILLMEYVIHHVMSIDVTGKSTAWISHTPATSVTLSK